MAQSPQPTSSVFSHHPIYHRDSFLEPPPTPPEETPTRKDLIQEFYHYATKTIVLFGYIDERKGFPFDLDELPSVFYGVQRIAINGERSEGREERSGYKKSGVAREEKREEEDKEVEEKDDDVVIGPWYKGFRVEDFIYDSENPMASRENTSGSRDAGSDTGSGVCYRLMRVETFGGTFDTLEQMEKRKAEKAEKEKEAERNERKEAETRKTLDELKHDEPKNLETSAASTNTETSTAAPAAKSPESSAIEPPPYRKSPECMLLKKRMSSYVNHFLYTSTPYHSANSFTYATAFHTVFRGVLPHFTAGEGLYELIMNTSSTSSLQLGIMWRERLIMLVEACKWFYSAFYRLVKGGFQFSREVGEILNRGDHGGETELDPGRKEELRRLIPEYVESVDETLDKMMFFTSFNLLLVDCRMPSVEERMLRYLKASGYQFIDFE